MTQPRTSDEVTHDSSNASGYPARTTRYWAVVLAVRLIVVHTAEGARTIESLGSYFQGNVQASSHTGADDKTGTIGEYVKRSNKAWTQGNFNPAAVAIELCGFAAWDTAEWDRHPNMLDNCARWIAEEAKHYGIPITKLNADQAQGSGRGVCAHNELGSIALVVPDRALASHGTVCSTWHAATYQQQHPNPSETTTC